MRYEERHPTVSCRVTMDIHKRIEEVKAREGRNLLDIIKKGLGVSNSQEEDEYVEPEVEAEVDTKVEIEVNEASRKLDVRKDWENFQKDSEIEKRKTKLRSYAKNDLVFLRESVIEYKNKGVFDQTYDDRQKMFRHEIEDFVLKYIDEVDTIEAISELEGVLEQISENLVSMIKAYDIKAEVGK